MHQYPQMYTPGHDAAMLGAMGAMVALMLAVVALMAVVYFVWWLSVLWRRHDPKKYRPQRRPNPPPSWLDSGAPDNFGGNAGSPDEPPDPYQGQVHRPDTDDEPDPYQSQWQPNADQDDMPWKPEPNSGGTWSPSSSDSTPAPNAEPEPPRKLSTVRLRYSAAFEMLTDGELEELRHRADGVLHRLRRASQLLANGQTQEAENLCFVARIAIRQALGDGKHWLEAVILSDLGAFSHESKKTEDAEYYFERAETVASPWLERYPWLRSLVSTRRPRD